MRITLARGTIIMAKRKQDVGENVEGFLHSVSPLKRSRDGKTNFFNGVIQTEEKFNDIVVFNRNINTTHQAFMEMQKSRSAVKLVDVEKVVSRKKTGEFDVKFTDQSRLTSPVKKLEFRYHTPEDKIVNLKQVLEMSSGAQVNFKAKVTKKGEVCIIIHDRNQNKLRKTDMIIADNSSAITLVAWENDIDKLNVAHSYFFKSITVRTYADLKTLTTNPNTLIQEIKDIGAICNTEVETDDTTKDISISGVKCTISYKCTNCNKLLIVNKHVPITKCEVCKMHFKISNLKERISCQIVAEGNTYNIYETVLQQSLPPTVERNENDITMFFLMEENFKIKYKKSNLCIINFERVRPPVQKNPQTSGSAVVAK